MYKWHIFTLIIKTLRDIHYIRNKYNKIYVVFNTVYVRTISSLNNMKKFEKIKIDLNKSLHVISDSIKQCPSYTLPALTLRTSPSLCPVLSRAVLSRPT